MDERSKVSLTFGAYINKTSVSIGLTLFCKNYDFCLNSYKEKRTFQDYSNINALGIKFGLAVKEIKVDKDS